MRRFEFVDGASNKFWEAKTEGPKLMVRFGRIGRKTTRSQWRLF